MNRTLLIGMKDKGGRVNKEKGEKGKGIPASVWPVARQPQLFIYPLITLSPMQCGV